MAKLLRVLAVLMVVPFSVSFAVPHDHHDPAAAQSAPLPAGNIADYRPGAMDIGRIREIGTIPNLNQGIEITIHNLSTRLIAWPGQGMVQGALHLVTVKPGQESGMYRYPVSEESLEVLKGKGEVYLWDKWVTIEPGDVAYIPEGIPHAIRNRNKSGEFVVIAGITPPQLNLYEDSGLFSNETGKFDEAKIDELTASSKQGTLTALTDLKFHDTHSAMRAWNVETSMIRKKGALFNIFYGARFEGIGVPMVIVLFPGYGTRNAGLHTGILPKGKGADAHTHSMSDDCVIYLQGDGNISIDGHSITSHAFDAVAAPILAPHGAGEPPPDRVLLSGYGSPPQQELYERQGYLKGNQYIRPKFERLEEVEKSQ